MPGSEALHEKISIVQTPTAGQTTELKTFNISRASMLSQQFLLAECVSRRSAVNQNPILQVGC